jgi:hypothetical protein
MKKKIEQLTDTGSRKTALIGIEFRLARLALGLQAGNIY